MVKKLLPYQTLVFITYEKTKNSYNNNKFKISGPAWNDKFELPDGLYSVSAIQDYFEYILKKHGENTDKPSVQIYANKRILLNRAPSSTQLHPPPPSSFQSPPSSLLHPQQYLNQNIAHNWAISPNLGRKIKSYPF